MNKKNGFYIIITGIVAITLVWLSQSNRGQKFDLKLPNRKDLTNNAVNKPTTSTLEGALWKSDNDTKCNLMLLTSNATIYIKTSRDFNELVGKNVVASIDGTLENFTLLNLEKNLAKDGFIQV